MNKGVTGGIAFIFGTAFGSLVTWALVKKKYEQLAQEEIDSVKEAYAKREDAILKTSFDNLKDAADTAKESLESFKEAAKLAKDKPDILTYHSTLNKNNYGSYHRNDKKEGDDEVNDIRPYVISPDEFGTKDYDEISLTYYADKVLADEDDEIVEDVESIVGFESLTHFGEYEDDSVFVRNEALGCDIEILLDQRKYRDVLKTKPRSKG